MEHFNAPRNAGYMPDADFIGRSSHGGAPPRTEIYLKLAGDVVAQASFTTFGCGVSIACCSVLTEMITGQVISQAALVCENHLVAALDGVPADKRYCATVAIEALRDALNQAQHRATT